MKFLLTIFVLFFSSSVVADDISDFQIEGISLGDSLLDYLTEEEILNNDKFIYKNNKFAIITCNKNSKIYEWVQCTFMPNDKKYLIYGVSGVIVFHNNINACLKKKNKVVKEISNIFENTEMKDHGTYLHGYDESSTQTVVDFDFEDGGYVRVVCHDWSDDTTKNKGFRDEFKVYLTSKDLSYFLNYEAYD